MQKRLLMLVLITMFTALLASCESPVPPVPDGAGLAISITGTWETPGAWRPGSFAV